MVGTGDMDVTSQDIICQQNWLQGPYGALFVARWQPAVPDNHPVRAPIILLHDSLGCVTLWRGFPATLAASSGREVIAYDRAGFGRSEARHHPMPLDFIEQEARGDLQAVIEGLALERFILLGHSVGGGMAIAGAATHHARCQAVITLAAQAMVEELTLNGIREAQRLFAEPDQRARLARYHGSRTEWVLSAWIDSWLAPAFRDWCLDASLAALRCPLLVIHGAQDEYGSASQPARLTENAGRGAELHLLDDCGHVPHREQPEEVMTRLVRFLAACV